MKKNIIVSIFGWLKSFFSELGRVFTHKEKIIIFFFAIIFIGAGFILLYDNFIKFSKEAPVAGGTYREGVVAKIPEELTDTINRLTKIGLTRFDDQGKIAPAVALSWEVSADVKNFTFTIKSDYSRDEVIGVLEKQKDKWPNIQIKPQDNDKIVFSFPDAYSPFLASTTMPVLPYGVYKLENNKDTDLTFIRNDKYIGQKPYLDKIVLKIYPDKENLDRAYKSKEIDGVYYAENAEDYPLSNMYDFSLPRYNMMFFNTSREIFKDKDIRKKITNGEKLDSEININVVALDTKKYRQIVEEFAQKWPSQNIKATVYYKSPNELLGTIIPKRDYDILFYGLNYGADPDPYPFWHSTQSGDIGLNLSNFSNIDADVALEDARKTTDEKIRQEKYTEFWKILADEAPAVIISQDTWSFAVGNKFKGVATGWSVGPEDRFLKITEWYTKTKRIK